MQTLDARSSHDDYQPMLDAVTQTFSSVKNNPLFTTDAGDLWRVWLSYLPEGEQQHHNCHACRRFIEKYGGLVTINDAGEIEPATIRDAPGIYADAFHAVAGRVLRSRVTGVFVSSDRTWGLVENSDKKRERTWRHMHVTPAPETLYKRVLLTADQRAAELHEDHGALMRACAEFDIETIRQAVSIAETEALYRSEKIVCRLRWFLDVVAMRRSDKDGLAKANLSWRAVATAPAGFCHVKSSVVGSLLEDLQSGKPFADVKRSFDAKMHPLQYQRPQAPPSVGNIEQAEKAVEKLGIAPSLRRRFARLEELKTIWTPAAPKPDETRAPGVFGHLRDAADGKHPPVVASAPPITYVKFEKVLASADSIEAYVPNIGHFTALVTAADPDAPPIIQWDRTDARNPVSWYTYSGGKLASQWNLRAASWTKVNAVTRMPNSWQPGFEHHGDGVLFVIDGCRDMDSTRAGAALFPELLKSELHAVRRTIEAFSLRATVEEPEKSTACGLTVRSVQMKSEWLRIRVSSRGIVTEYVIDRWD